MREDGMKLDGWVRNFSVTGVLSILLMLTASAAIGARGGLVMQTAPDFALKTLDGKNLRLSEYRGEVVLLSFGASWCGRCQEQLSVLGALNGKIERREMRYSGIQLLGINLDKKRNSVQEMAGDLRLDFPILLDEKNLVAELYGLGKMPLLVLIDPRGTVRWVHQGYQQGDEDVYLDQVAKLLAE